MSGVYRSATWALLLLLYRLLVRWCPENDVGTTIDLPAANFESLLAVRTLPSSGPCLGCLFVFIWPYPTTQIPKTSLRRSAPDLLGFHFVSCLLARCSLALVKRSVKPFDPL